MRNGESRGQGGREEDQACALPWVGFHLFFFFKIGYITLVGLELYINQAVLKLRELPASTFQVLGLKLCASLTGLTSLVCPGLLLVSWARSPWSAVLLGPALASVTEGAFRFSCSVIISHRAQQRNFPQVKRWPCKHQS